MTKLLTKDEILILHRLAYRGEALSRLDIEDTIVQIIEALGGSARPSEVERILSYTVGTPNARDVLNYAMEWRVVNYNYQEGWLTVNV